MYSLIFDPFGCARFSIFSNPNEYSMPVEEPQEQPLGRHDAERQNQRLKRGAIVKQGSAVRTIMLRDILGAWSAWRTLHSTTTLRWVARKWPITNVIPASRAFRRRRRLGAVGRPESAGLGRRLLGAAIAGGGSPGRRPACRRDAAGPRRSTSASAPRPRPALRGDCFWMCSISRMASRPSRWAKRSDSSIRSHDALDCFFASAARRPWSTYSNARARSSSLRASVA